MTRLRLIVAATDFLPGADAAVVRAAQLAKEHGASLHLLHTFNVSAWHSLKGVFDPYHLTMDPPQDVRMHQRLTKLAAVLATQTGIGVEAHFCVGNAHTAINAYATAHKPSLVVIGTRAEPGIGGVGSTASKVLRSPICPILVVRKTDVRPYDKVLSAIDMRENSLHALSVAVALFPAAQHHLLHALEQKFDHLRTYGVAVEQIRLIRASMHREANAEMQKIATSLSMSVGHPVTTEVADDVPSRSIVNRAAALPADCVVVGHHGEGTMVGNFLGNMAQHIMHHTSRDVLVVP